MKSPRTNRLKQDRESLTQGLIELAQARDAMNQADSMLANALTLSEDEHGHAYAAALDVLAKARRAAMAACNIAERLEERARSRAVPRMAEVLPFNSEAAARLADAKDAEGLPAFSLARATEGEGS